jgi:hypothetical protein
MSDGIPHPERIFRLQRSVIFQMQVWALAMAMALAMVGAKHPEMIFVVQRPGIFRMLRPLYDRYW